MKTIGLTMIALGLAVAALPADAQGQTSFTLETHTEGSGGYFTFAGETAHNPTLNVAPGQPITITVKGTDDGFHNICYKDSTTCATGGADGYVEKAGDTITLTFTAPASGTAEYFCMPHKGAGMKGTINAGGATTTPEGNDGDDKDNDSPGFGLAGALVALAGLALVLRRK